MTAASNMPLAAPSTSTPTYELAGFIWSVADLLRGDYKHHDFGKVILPFTVLRRLDCVLAPTKAKVLDRHEKLKATSQLPLFDPILNKVTGRPFHNVSKLDFEKMLGAPADIAQNLTAYIKGFSENVRDILLERFKIQAQIEILDNANLLFLVMKKFGEIDLHPDKVDNHTMGLVFEDLIRRFAEQSNETAGEHFTPREVIRLMVNLLFIEDGDLLTQPGIVRTLYDPACGTGGMLSVAEEFLRELNPEADLKVFGQELNDETFAICKADMLIKGQAPENVAPGNSFSADGHAGASFDYCISNPPFGVEWKKVKDVVEKEHEQKGHAGRFGPGLPRINDGSLLFLLHMISKMKRPEDGGSRIAIVLNGSPLFTGDAGSGESEIRRWVLENDWLEAIVALPDQLFFNTGIFTYVWVVSNRKPPERKGKVQLINGTKMFAKMRKSLGNKRNYLTEDHIRELSERFGDFEAGEASKIFDNEDFGFRKITVERPLRLRFAITPEAIARLDEEKAFQNLAKSKKKGKAGEEEAAEGKRLQDYIKAVLKGLRTDETWSNREQFLKHLKAEFKKRDLKLAAAVEKAVLAALSERDETADICTDKKDQPEPDPELRDTENVPLKEDIHTYFEREVKPHVPDAWIDDSKTKVGYEIPFTRHFYEYKPLRPLADIEADIRTLEAEIQSMLGGILK